MSTYIYIKYYIYLSTPKFFVLSCDVRVFLLTRFRIPVLLRRQTTWTDRHRDEVKLGRSGWTSGVCTTRDKTSILYLYLRWNWNSLSQTPPLKPCICWLLDPSVMRYLRGTFLLTFAFQLSWTLSSVLSEGSPPWRRTSSLFSKYSSNASLLNKFLIKYPDVINNIVSPTSSNTTS